MNKENADFLAGLILGIVTSIIVSSAVGITYYISTTSGYENKLVIKYHNPHQEYDREMVRNMVNDSQVWTNFVVREMKMGKHEIEYRMSNPKEGGAK